MAQLIKSMLQMHSFPINDKPMNNDTENQLKTSC